MAARCPAVSAAERGVGLGRLGLLGLRLVRVAALPHAACANTASGLGTFALFSGRMLWRGLLAPLLFLSSRRGLLVQPPHVPWAAESAECWRGLRARASAPSQAGRVRGYAHG